jgi:hypothetical protein
MGWKKSGPNAYDRYVRRGRTVLTPSYGSGQAAEEQAMQSITPRARYSCVQLSRPVQRHGPLRYEEGRNAGELNEGHVPERNEEGRKEVGKKESIGTRSLDRVNHRGGDRIRDWGAGSELDHQ